MQRTKPPPAAPMASSSGISVPMIPGLLSTQRHMIGRTNFHKGQLLEQMAQGKAIHDPVLVPVTNNSTQSGDPSSAWLNVAEHHRPHQKSNQVQNATATHTAPSTAPAPATTTQSTRFRKDATQPKWITHDRQVLRFFGYFQEPVVQEIHSQAQPITHHRVRRVVVFFYLSDHSLSISEPRVLNSGIAQGEFMKRTLALTPRGTKFEPEDFNLGGYVTLYGRKIHLVDCDAATRTFYDEALSQPLGSPRPYPDDKQHSQIDEIDALKTRLRANAASVAESKAEKVRKFHENSQQVLRFFVCWRDAHPLYPETRKYVLHYYLSDDTMEIVEPRSEREGRGHFAVVLSRRRMASDDINKSSSTSTSTSPFIRDTDLRCGEFVHVFARKFLLEDCDAFTREYYLTTHGITQEKHDPEAITRREKAAKWKLFQVNPHDVLTAMAATDTNQQLHHTRRDGRQLTGHGTSTGHATASAIAATRADDALANRQLRFRARLHDANTNAQREFVVTYYLEDDTLAVFEPRVKNSGVGGGRFLDRGRFRKCDVSAGSGGGAGDPKSSPSAPFYQASDLFVGAVVGFAFAPQQKLELIEADRQTLTFCESHPQQFPFSDGQAVVSRLASTIRRQHRPQLSVSVVRRECRAMDAATGAGSHARGRQLRGVIAVSDVKRLLTRLGLANALNAQQLITLCRRFEDTTRCSSGGNHPGPPPFVYDDFCDALATAGASSTVDKSKDRDVFSRLRSCSTLRRLLREAAAADTHGAVTMDALVDVTSAFKVSLSSSERHEIATTFAASRRSGTTSRSGAVDLNALCDRVFGGDVEPRERDQEILEDDDDEEVDDPGSYSLRQQDEEEENDEDDDYAFDQFGGDAGDACEPPQSTRPLQEPASPRRRYVDNQPVAVPHLPLRGVVSSSALVAPRGGGKPRATATTTSTTSDVRVVALLRRVFGERKYLLRKALRDRDQDKSGLLGEEPFMDAVLSVEPQLSDDDTYLIADVYFPTNNSKLDYPQLLESAFRS